MANYTAADVKKLRELTGSGMLDCKNALVEVEGDFDKAVELLRIKGAKDVGKRAERSTAEGLVVAHEGVMVELNCETDFVGKNQEFLDLADKIVKVAAAAQPANAEELLAADLDGETVEAVIAALSAKIGEKLVLRRVVCLDGNISTYMHKRSADLPPQVGVMVQYTGDTDEAKEAAYAAAMQVAALKATYTRQEDVPADVVEKERSIAEATAKEEGKPEAALPKIVEGRLKGFFKDAVLVDQPSVKDSKQTVGAMLAAAGAEVQSFVRFEVGQG